MPHAHSLARRSLLRRTLLQTLVASLIPLGTAYAQVGAQAVGAHVRVSAEETKVTEWSHERGDVLMRPVEGNVFEVIDVEGDRYVHRKSNWYRVVLPRDPWGTRRTGWVSGHEVEQFTPEAKAAPASEARVTEVARPEPARTEPAKNVAPPPVPVATPNTEADKPELCEVVLNFQFGKSDLTDEAKGKLASAVATLKSNPQGVSFALEGHADSTGPEAYNEKLSLARAETVKRYLAEQHMVPLHKISVTGFGEKAPAASNATKEGRAENRRVVVKVGA
jgi:OmpA-OmpF porin, OOP family